MNLIDFSLCLYGWTCCRFSFTVPEFIHAYQLLNQQILLTIMVFLYTQNFFVFSCTKTAVHYLLFQAQIVASRGIWVRFVMQVSRYAQRPFFRYI